ncbi:uncharacterized protein [Penaeus vannamei]|uniref:uncharacterized protein n=1 Tax=Penaeus vannamei TaxID=6689 RepID=UPI00387F6048
MARELHAVLAAIWQSGTVPPDLLRVVFIPLWKGKGNRWDCSNHRGITVLSIPGKVLGHILLRRIRDLLLRHQRPEHSGFTPGKSTIDRILALRVIVERRRQFGLGLLAAYIDLKKTFDTVHRESLWEILRLRGIPTRIIGLIASLHTGIESDTKTKIQVFGDLLGGPARSAHACGEDIEVRESFTYLGSVVHNSGLSDLEVGRRIGLAAEIMNSLDKSPCAGSWGTVAGTMGPTSGCTLNLTQDLLFEQSVIANSGF